MLYVFALKLRDNSIFIDMRDKVACGLCILSEKGSSLEEDDCLLLGATVVIELRRL